VKKGNKYLLIVIFSVMTIVSASTALSAQSVPMGTIVGTWDLKFDNGAKGSLVVDKTKATIEIAKFFKGEGGTGDRGDYVEFFMSGKNNQRLFVFGFLKGGVLEGTVQDRAPCDELKKNFGNLVKVVNTSCQVPFKASKK